MTIKLNVNTVAELHAQLQALVDQGLGDTPVVTTDCRARYPFQAYTVRNQSGYVDAFLIYARPDARFVSRETAPASALDKRAWIEYKAHGWNVAADQTAESCGAFA